MLVSYLQTSHPPCWSVMSRLPIQHVGQLTPDVPSTMLISYLQTSHPPCWSVNSQRPIHHVGQLPPDVTSAMLVSYVTASHQPPVLAPSVSRCCLSPVSSTPHGYTTVNVSPSPHMLLYRLTLLFLLLIVEASFGSEHVHPQHGGQQHIREPEQ